MCRLLLTGVGDLGDRLYLIRKSLIAIPNSKDLPVAPDLAVLGDHLQALVHMDPLAAAGSLVRKHLLRHEIIGRLHTNADVGLIRLTGHAVLLPVVGIVLHTVCGLDALLSHVLVAIPGSAVRQRSQTLAQEVDDEQLELREVVLQLGDPLDSNEPSTNYQDGCAALIQVLQNGVLLQDVPAASLNVPLIQMLPVRMRPGHCVDCGEPQRLPIFVHRVKIAPGRDHTVVKLDDFLFREHGLHASTHPSTIELSHLAPHVLHSQIVLESSLQCESEVVEVFRVHVSTQDTRSVLEEFFGVHTSDPKRAAQVSGAHKTAETGADNQDPRARLEFVVEQGTHD
mmetsp:Transcript_2763/g.6304  ORF Transcript_2763/g.6304 Transcript_2763/m.6304 type:complete len:340 (+) Transcript_2763:288-1307(+)